MHLHPQIQNPNAFPDNPTVQESNADDDHLSNVILLWAASSSSSSLIEGEVPVTTLLFADKYSTGLEKNVKNLETKKSLRNHLYFLSQNFEVKI